MKCPECGGVGRIHYGEEWCSVCNGTGECDANKVDRFNAVDFIKVMEMVKKPQTNEEWFVGLSTEEKAKVFANATYSTAETPLTILWGGKEAEQKKWERWLKQPHTNE